MDALLAITENAITENATTQTDASSTQCTHQKRVHFSSSTSSPNDPTVPILPSWGDDDSDDDIVFTKVARVKEEEPKFLSSRYLGGILPQLHPKKVLESHATLITLNWRLGKLPSLETGFQEVPNTGKCECARNPMLKEELVFPSMHSFVVASMPHLVQRIFIACLMEPYEVLVGPDTRTYGVLRRVCSSWYRIGSSYEMVSFLLFKKNEYLSSLRDIIPFFRCDQLLFQCLTLMDSRRVCFNESWPKRLRDHDLLKCTHGQRSTHTIEVSAMLVARPSNACGKFVSPFWGHVYQALRTHEDLFHHVMLGLLDEVFFHGYDITEVNGEIRQEITEIADRMANFIFPQWHIVRGLGQEEIFNIIPDKNKPNYSDSPYSFRGKYYACTATEPFHFISQ